MTDSNGSLRELEARLTDWLFRLRLRDALLWSVRGLGAGLAAGLGLSLAARLRPLQTVPVLIAVSLSLAFLGFALGLAIAYFWPRSRLAAARYFDGLFALKERTTTALELAADSAAAPEWLMGEQWADAAAAARSADPRRQLPLTFDRRDVLLLAVAAGALALSLYLPNPQQAVLLRQQEVAQAVAQQVQQIEAVRDQIQNDPHLTDAQKEALTQPLDEALSRLQQDGLTQEQAVQVLAQAQSELRALADPNAQGQASALQQAGDALSQNPTTQEAGQALAGGDFQSAADALSNLDLSQLSAAEQQALADTLEQAAQNTQAGAPDVAQQLQAAADALRQGNTDGAESALRNAGQAVGHYGSAFAQAQAAGQAADQLQQSQDSVAQAGQGEAAAGAQSQQAGQGQAGEGQGQGQPGGQGGQGQGQAQGEGGSGGAGRGEGTGEAQGGAAGTSPIGQGNGQGDGGESTYEPIYTPYTLGGSGGSDVTLPGSGDNTGDVVGEGPVNPQNTGQVTVPYNEVYSAYADAAHAAVDSGEVPVDLRDVVKQYFSSLEP